MRKLAVSSFFVLALPGRALAADAGRGEAEELARSIAEQAEALSTDDCSSACKALASMRRAADRLCALDPGDRCAEARERVDAATNKVREACPACAIPTAPVLEQRTPEAAAAAPPPEHRAGGCAGCATTDADGSHAAGGLALALALAAARRRRRRRRG